MGVRSCDRNGCKNVLCDTRIEGFDICSSCEREFREKIGSEPKAYAYLLQELLAFMKSFKCEPVPPLTVDEFFDRSRIL